MFNEKQEQQIVEFRSQYVEYQNKIDQAKDDQKSLFSDLIDTLGLDKKIDKEKIKDIKKGFKLYVKQNAPEEVASVQRAAEVAGL